MNSSEKKSVLIVGPLPPPPTGAHVTFQNFCDEAKNQLGADSVEIIDSSQKLMKKNVKRIASLGNLKQAWRIAKQFRRKLKSARHVLVLGSNGFMLSMAPILLVLARRAKTPLHIRPFGGSLDQYLARQNPLFRRLLLWTLRTADGLSVETELLKRGLSPVIGKNIEVAPNYRYIPDNGPACLRAACLDSNNPLNNDVDAAIASDEDPLRLIYIGIVGEEKGLFVLLESLTKLAERGVKVHCDIFGPLSPASAQRLEEAFSQTDLATYKGMLNPDEAIATIGSYHALVMPTHYQGEGHPGVVIEAMIAGIPVIATNHRSIPELVKDGVNGLLAPPRDPEALAEAIEKLYRDRQLIIQLGTKSWEMRTQFDTRKIVPLVLRQMGVDPDDYPQSETGAGSRDSTQANVGLQEVSG